MDRNILTAVAVAAACFLVVGTSYAQPTTQPGSRLAVSGHGWYGIDMEKTRPNLESYGYMTYELALGIQTTPEGRSPYAHAFGYPMFSFGASIARMGDFRFSDQTKFPDLYALYGSFERSALRKEHFSMGYLLDFGLAYNPGRYDPVNNPGNNWLSAPVMAYFGAGAFAKWHFGRR